jgi:hypothetical protein
MDQIKPIPHFKRYFWWWCAVWCAVTCLTQIPERYERSVLWAPWDHENVLREFCGFAFQGAIINIVCGLGWSLISWLMQWMALSVSHWHQKRMEPRRTRPASKWVGLGAILFVTVVETVGLGIPLAAANTSFANFGIAGDDTPEGYDDSVPFVVSDRSIAIQSGGIMLAFPFACIVAGLRSLRRAEECAGQGQI